MPTKLNSNVISVVVPSDHAQKLARIAQDKGVTVSQLINEVLAPLLAEDNDDADTRCVVLYIPEHTWETYVEFFENDMRFVLQSMSAHIEHGGDDFSRGLKLARETE